jgi:Asp-tRNA(Asn)/Glu-tRNA(Gln) amidotransferase A subunit family amidase
MSTEETMATIARVGGELYRLTATEAAGQIRSGALSPVDLVEACLARIEAREPALKAWVLVDALQARRVARERDDEARAGRFRGPLHGVPVALKDIYHVEGLVTTAGADAFFHQRPSADAASVARLRAAGAIVLGKTTTTEFANVDPTETRNPWNPEHTPGGSSSGSAAAVGAGMAPFALGSQTVGSTLRPAAYCGIVGFKATHGRVSTTGVVALAWSFDTVGILCRSVADVALGVDVLSGYDAQDPASVDTPPLACRAALSASAAPPRLGIPRRFVETAQPETIEHVYAVADRCRRAGASVQDIELPPSFVGVQAAGRVVVAAESATFHAEHFPARAELYREGFRGTLAAGAKTAAVDYVRALRQCRLFRRDIEGLMPPFDALLMPTAPAPAPRGLASTGDPVFCAPWSCAGVPAIALPSGVAAEGMPLSVQLVAAPWREAELLRAARWVEALLDWRSEPR